MQTVKVARLELLAKVRENRDAHIKLYEEAKVGFVIESEKFLKKVLKDLKKTGDWSGYAALSKPTNNIKDYDAAIMKLEMSVDDVIELEDHEFKQLVLDEWQWKQAFVGNNTLYAASAKAR